jgi:hypothetical protein
VAKFDTLIDDFSAVSLGASWALDGTLAAYGGGVVTLPIDTAQNNLKTVGPWDITSSTLYAQVTMPATGNGTHQNSFRVSTGTNTNTANEMRFFRSGVANLDFRYTIAGAPTTLATITYDPVAHAWFRFRHAAGTVFWETSPEGHTWTVRASTALISWDLTNVFLRVTSSRFGAETAGSVVVDNVNTAPPLPAPALPFPAGPLPVVVQAKIDGATWTDITEDTYTRDLITIDRGLANEQSKAEPTKIGLQLNNRDGRYSPRNPAGPHYGLIGRGTELRVGITEELSWLAVPGPTGTISTPGQYVQTPDNAALDISPEIDLRFDADLDTWREALELISKSVDSTNQRSYALLLSSAGRLQMFRSVDGITWGLHESDDRLPFTRGRWTVRAVFAGNNGAGGRTTIFYYGPSLAGPWTQLGSSITTTGTVTIFNSTAPVTILDNPGSNPAFFAAIQGRVYGAEIRSSIGGTVVGKPDFTVVAPGATSFVDSVGRTWTLTGTTIENVDVRGHGEVAAWPTRWDVSGLDVWASLEAAGMTRRLGQGASPITSAMFRGATSSADTDVVAYWPVEDSDGATTIAAGRQGGRPMQLAAGDNTTFSAFSSFPGSAPIATLGDESIWNGSVASYTGTGRIQVWWLMAVPSGGTTNNQGVIGVTTTGTIGRVVARYFNTGSMELVVYDQNNTLIYTSTTTGFAVNGKLLKCSIDLVQNGSDVEMELKVLEVGQEVGFSSVTYTVPGRTISRATGVQVSPGANFPDVSMGHIEVHSSIRSLYDSYQELNAWRGERMGRRMQRLCREEGVAFRGYGDLDDTVVGGFQGIKTLLELIQECADTDGGVLAESRDSLAISYVPRSSMQSQLVADVTIPYASQTDLIPVEDDTSVANDVTVSRPDGGSRRVELLAGPMSIEEAPNGIGRYQTSESMNLGYDTQLEDHANWRLHVGTVDEARFPSIMTALEHPDISGDTGLTTDLRIMDLGDRFVITGPMPAWVAPDNIDQVVIGTRETLGVFEHWIEANCLPYRPFRVGIYDNTESRYDTGGSTLAVSATTTATSISVASTEVLWTTDVAMFPFPAMLGPERVTVTAITGTSSPQTATIVRSVNQVVNAPAAGTEFRLADPVYYGL